MTPSPRESVTSPGPLVVVVDGDCALCVGVVEWIGRRIAPSPETVIFVPGQSDLGSEVLRRASVVDFDSVLVVRGGVPLTESTAVLALVSILPRAYRAYRALAEVARVVPPSWRDAVYCAIARRRMSIWGRAEVCAIDSRVAAATYGPRGLLSRDAAKRLLVLAGALKK